MKTQLPLTEGPMPRSLLTSVPPILLVMEIVGFLSWHRLPAWLRTPGDTLPLAPAG